MTRAQHPRDGSIIKGHEESFLALPKLGVLENDENAYESREIHHRDLDRLGDAADHPSGAHESAEKL